MQSSKCALTASVEWCVFDTLMHICMRCSRELMKINCLSCFQITFSCNSSRIGCTTVILYLFYSSWIVSTGDTQVWSGVASFPGLKTGVGTAPYGNLIAPHSPCRGRRFPVCFALSSLFCFYCYYVSSLQQACNAVSQFDCSGWLPRSRCAACARGRVS